ncbi:MAG: SET domain-containing protein [Candidatus Nanoarchaeia archaeon]|nr:SET domain-containing protein [Candidatus Nanoarchaeia archaeon]
MDGIIIKKIGGNGRGVFANKSFKKNELILKIKHKKLLSDKEASKVSYHFQNHMSYVGSGKYAIMGIPERYINHSCDPNTYFKHNGSNEQIIAIKTIKKGQEITADYTIDSNPEDKWWMNCICKSKNCRKIIKAGFKKLDKKLQKKYLKYAPSWNKKD